MRVSLRSVLLVCSLGLAATTAHAGEKNPDVEACAGKQAGDACQRTVVTKSEGGPAETKKLPGACAEDNCCELDYSKGSPPETVCAPCLACKEGPGTPSPSVEGGDVAAGDEGVATPQGDATPSDDGSPPAADPGKRGCSVGADATRSLGLAGLLVLGALRRRRR